MFWNTDVLLLTNRRFDIMKNLKISVPALFRLLAAFLALTMSLQVQADCGCVGNRRNTPEQSFEEADLVATITYVGLYFRDESLIRKFRIVDLKKSPLGLRPGAIIVIDHMGCECCAYLPNEGTFLVYLRYRGKYSDRDKYSDKARFYASMCDRQ